MLTPERLITHLSQLPAENFIGIDREKLLSQTQALIEKLSANPYPPKILIVESQPLDFLASFIAGVSLGYPLFLGNPQWGEIEWQQVQDLVKPDIILNDKNLILQKPSKINDNLALKNLIMIPTGGTSGKIKFAIHNWNTLTASLQGFTQYFNLEAVNSCCLLPLYHVSGLMQFLRSIATQGIFAHINLNQNQYHLINPKNFFISLVPTQLNRLLQNRETAQWLAEFATVLLGGAPAWQDLLDRAKKQHIRLAPTYGMTETASQIVTLKPQDFLTGNQSCGQVLPHAEVKIIDEKNHPLPTNKIGNIIIKSSSLSHGYYPEINPPTTLKTNDLGFFDNQGYLYVIGRNNEQIISGGENVFPAEVEAALFATNLIEDTCVLGIPDSDWGEAITAVYVPKNSNISEQQLQAALTGKLTPYKLPKYWLNLPRLPRNHQGKIDRPKLKQIVYNHLNLYPNHRQT